MTPAPLLEIATEVEEALNEGGCPHTLPEVADVIGDAIAHAGYRLVPVSGLPSEAKARRTDSAESWDAARTIHDCNVRQRCVYAVLWNDGPLTDAEIDARYRACHARGGGHGWPNQTPASLRSRRAELVQAGLVRATGETRPTASGRQAQVWAVVT